MKAQDLVNKIYKPIAFSNTEKDVQEDLEYVSIILHILVMQAASTKKVNTTITYHLLEKDDIWLVNELSNRLRNDGYEVSFDTPNENYVESIPNNDEHLNIHVNIIISWEHLI